MTKLNPERDAYIVRAFKSGTTAAALAEVYGVQPPAITRVLRRNGIHQAPHKSHPRRPYIRATMAEKREEAPEPVDRDPCFMCGTRGDYGCSHRKVFA